MKTVPTDRSVDSFLDKAATGDRREDARTLVDMMRRVTGKQPVLWGDSIVGFGSHHYKYASGREGDAPLIGFSPRKTALTLYIIEGFGAHEALLGRLGPYKTGKSCLYIGKLADVDITVLEDLMRRSVARMRERYPTSG